jgi:hypothetical protein
VPVSLAASFIEDDNMNNRSPRLLAHFLIAFAAFAFAGWAHADPPSRVARIAYVSGNASFSPGSEPDTWVHANINRPMVTGDRMWVERGARAELQLGQAAIRAAGGTSLSLLNLDDRVVQLQLNEGTLNVRVRRLDRGQTFEIDTPNLAYSIRRPGNYRIEVDANGDATTVLARVGMAEAYGEGSAFITTERVTYRFFGTGLREYQTFSRWGPDEFDRWASDRDRRWDSSASRRFVSMDMIGYEDLDANGTWRRVPDYGNVWIPSHVAADWAPYRDGHWSWVEPWGWTWIDDAPWGFAPSHYGRWAHLQSGWAWVPGPAQVQPVYAPALVAFVGGGNLRLSGGSNAVAWFPLGPREVYRPSYTTSREYFERVNTTNTVVDRTTIVNVYNNPAPREVRYVNQQVPGALIAMLAVAFAESRPVAKEAQHVDRAAISGAMNAPVAHVAPVAPMRTSVVGAAPATAKPPAASFTRPVVAQVAPPPPPVAFEARQKALEANIGKPHDAAAVAAATKPAQPPAAPQVKVVQAEKPVAAPAKPASAPEPKPNASVPPPAAAPAPAAPAAASAASPPASRARGPASAFAPPPPAAATAPAPAPAPATASAPTPPRAERPASASAPAASAAAARRDERDRAREERGRPGLARPGAPEAPAAPPPAAATAPARPPASAAPAAAAAAPAAPPAAARPAPAAEARPASEAPARREAPPPRAPAREASAPPPAAAAPATPAPPPAPPRAATPPAPPPPPPHAATPPATPPAPPAAAPPPRAASASAPPATPAAAAESRGAGQAAVRREAASERREAASERRKQREEERKP